MRARSTPSHDSKRSTRSPRRTSVPEPLCVKSSLASSAGRVMDTDEVSGRSSSRSLICSIFRRMPECSHGCWSNCSYSVDRLIESMTLPSPSSRPPVPVRNTILYGCSTRTSSFAAKSALMLRICPASVSPRLAITGIDPARRLASIGARLMSRTRPTRPKVSWSRNSAAKTPEGTEVARVSTSCSASTRRRFCAWKTLRTIASASGEVTRRPLMVFFSLPAAASSSSSCGPAPCSTMGVRPTCCRKDSDEVRSGSSSRSTAPPTFTTANRAASSCEKRFRYCWISRALPMEDSRRTMVFRVCLLESTVHDPMDGLGVMSQLVEGDPLVGTVCLGDVAGAIDEGGVTGLRKQCRLGPEVDGVTDRNTEFVGKVTRGETTGFRRRRVARRQRIAAEGFAVLDGMRLDERTEGLEQTVGVHRRQRAETEADIRGRRDHVGLDATLDLADVEAQAGESTEALVRLRLHMVECRRTPADGLVQRAVGRLLFARGVPGLAQETHLHRVDATMREHRLAPGRFGDDDRLVVARRRQEAVDATRIVGLLVGRQQQRHVALGRVGHGNECRGGTLDVTGTEADRAVFRHPQFERAGGPVRGIRHGVHVDIEQVLRLAANGIEVHGTGPEIRHLHVEPGKVCAQIIEDPVGADRSWRVARVEPDQRAQMGECVLKERIHG